MKCKKFIACLMSLAMTFSFGLAACNVETNPNTTPPAVSGGGNGGTQTPTEPDTPTTPENPTGPDTPSNPDTEEQNGIKITAADISVVAGKYFDPLKGVTATDSEGNDISGSIKVSGSLDTSKAGVYSLNYTATDTKGNTCTKARKITVKQNGELGKITPPFVYNTDESYNIAQGCNVWATSENGGSTAVKATDGKEDTRWESVHGIDDVSYTVDLGAVLPIESISILWENACASQFEILSSDDNVDYEIIGFVGDFGKDGVRTYTAQFKSESARYIKLHCLKRYTGYGYSIYEFRVFGKSGTVIPASKYPVFFDAEDQSSPDWQIEDEQWIKVDLGAVKTFDFAEISFKDWISPAEYSVKVSSDGENYKSISINDKYIVENGARISVSARYILVEMAKRRFYADAYRINRILIKDGNSELTPAGVTASTESANHPVSDAVKLDNYTTYWESAHTEEPQTVDLGGVKAVGRVDLFWKGDDGRKGKYYDLQISDDGETFKTVFRQVHGGTEKQSVYLFENARFIRIIDYQSVDTGRYMLEGMVVHSQYLNESKVDYNVDIQFPEYKAVETQNGSYLTGGTDFPTAKLVTYIDEELRNKPIPSNDWWQSLLINDKGHNMYLNPLTAKFDQNGLWLTNPGDGYYSGDYPGNGRQTIDVDVKDIRIGYAGAGQNNFVKVVGYSDYSVACVMSDTEAVDKMTAYLSQGALYGYFVFAEPKNVAIYSDNLVGAFDIGGNSILNDGKAYTGDCIVVCVRTHSGYENDREQGNKKTYEERFYVINAPADTTFVLSENTIKVSMAAGNYLSVGAMSTVNTVSQSQADENTVHGAMNKSEAQTMHEHGYAFIIGTRCDMDFDGAENLVKTQYMSQVFCVSGSSEAYSAFMPHQYKKSADDLSGGYSYSTVRGDSRAYEGNVYQTSDRFYGIVPQFAEPTDGYSAAVLSDLILKLYNNVGGDKPAKECNLISGDPYWQGKNLHPMAMAALAADQIGATDLRDGFLGKIEYILEDWFNYTPGNEPQDAYFYYDSEWGTLYYKNSEFGAGVNLADHHFTYGYYTFAAGVLSAYRPAFAQKYGDMIEMLIRDYMNWQRDSDDFPFMRNYDVYAGHGWAGGYADNDGGNNQESAGEALNSWVGAYLYATAVGNESIKDTAICGFTTELNAIKQYWFNYGGDSFGEFYPYGAIGQLYGASNFFGTFFNGEPLYAYGIHLIPGEEFITSYAIGEEERENLKEVMQSLKNDQSSWNFSDENSKTLHAWQHIFIPVTACYDAASAIEWYDELVRLQGNIGNDNEQFNVYYMIHALNGLGGRTADIWAEDGASATVYEKDGTYTAVIWNPTAKEVKYTFRNRSGQTGYAVVPAQSLVTYDPCANTLSFGVCRSADSFGTGDFYQSNNVTASAQLVFGAGGSATYNLTFGRTPVYRRAKIKVNGEVRLLIDGQEYPLTETAEGYESAPLSLTLKHTVTLEADNAAVEEFTFENLTLKKLPVKLDATASSENGENKASNAVDGNNSTRWESVHRQDGEYITIELSEAATIYSLSILWEAASAREYTVSFSMTGQDGDWVEVFRGSYSQGARTDTVMPSTIMQTKYIRIYGISRTTDYGYSIYEVEIFGF